MTSLLIEAVQKLIYSKPQYVVDAVFDTSDRFEEMSDGGSDSLYAAPARRLRSLAISVDNTATDSSQHVKDEFDNDECRMIAAGILWYELNS